MIPYYGFAPDIDATEPGVITECTNIVPTLKGFAGGPSLSNTAQTSALASTCMGAASLKALDNSSRTFAGTTTKLYQASSGSWADVSRSSGGAYALTGEMRWRFAQFGNVSLAVAKSDKLQFYTSSLFADVSAAPKASIVETVNQFVFLFDTNEGTYSDSPNRWWCSALGDYTLWTPSISTQCATGLLTSSPGPIMAGKRLGDAIIVYKERSMFRGTYQGAPTIWDFQEVSNVIGSVSNEAVVSVATREGGYMHIFMGADDFYLFDGSRPFSIGAPVREYVFRAVNRQFIGRSIAMHDWLNGRINFYYPDSSGTLNKCVVYNYRTQKWGKADREIEAAFEYVVPDLTYNDLGSLYAQYNDLPSVAYDLAFLANQASSPGIFGSDHKLYTLTGVSDTSSITTGDIGNEMQFTLLQRVIPKFYTSPSSATMTNYYRNVLGDSLITGDTTSLSSGRFDIMRSARWHRAVFNFSGNVEVSGNTIRFDIDGDE